MREEDRNLQEMFSKISNMVYDDSKNILDRLSVLLGDGEHTLRCVPASGICLQLESGSIVAKARVRMFLSYNSKDVDNHGSMMYDLDIFIYKNGSVEMNRLVEGAPRMWLVGYSDNFEEYFLENFKHENIFYRI